MWKSYHCTSIGYSHIKANKVCQDYSDSYEDEERKIVTACDGHGGALYVRSDRGSRFASEAAISVLKSVVIDDLKTLRKQETEKRLRLKILCEWNARVESDLANEPLTDEETSVLDDDQKFRLTVNPVKAYGTTLNAAMIIGDKIVCVGIGDGGVFFLKGKTLLEMKKDDEEEPVANITYSLCQEDAYNHIVVGIFDSKDVDSVIVCTDGTVNPYRNYENFRTSFVLPITEKFKEKKEREITGFMKKLGEEIGIGDDVSVAIMQKTEGNEEFALYQIPKYGDLYTFPVYKK